MSTVKANILDNFNRPGLFANKQADWVNQEGKRAGGQEGRRAGGQKVKTIEKTQEYKTEPHL